MPRVPSLLLVLAATLGAQCDAPPPPPPLPAPVAVPTPASKAMDAIDAKHRAKAAELGLARADSAAMDHVDEFLCGKLLPSLLATRDVAERKALSIDVDTYGCRDRKEWGEIAVARARDLGMPDAESASMRALQSYVCRNLAEALSKAGSKSDKSAIDVERDIFGCAS